jgi:hypothetical protein
MKLCSSNATNTVDIATLKKAQLTKINTIKRTNKLPINARINTKLNNKKFFWATVIVRNSAQKLVEWIIWHFLMGVQHFLVYDNVSVDNVREALKPFIQANLVTLIPNVRDFMQIQSYNDALQRAKRRDVHWLMMMDVDEFIMTATTNTLLDLLFSHSMTSTIGAVQLQWLFIVPPQKGFLYKPLNSTFLELLTNDFNAQGYTHPKCSTKSIVKVAATTTAHVHYSKFMNITSPTSNTAAATTTATTAATSDSSAVSESGSVQVHGIDVFGRPIDSPWALKPWYCTALFCSVVFVSSIPPVVAI